MSETDHYTDDQIVRIRDGLYGLVEIIIDKYIEECRTGKTNNL